MTDEEAYDAAPCGLLSTSMDGTIVKVNSTLLDWLGLPRDAVVGRLRFPDLLTVGWLANRWAINPSDCASRRRMIHSNVRTGRCGH